MSCVRKTQGLSLLVCTGPKTSPVSSPTVSPSSSAASDLAKDAVDSFETPSPLHDPLQHPCDPFSYSSLPPFDAPCQLLSTLITQKTVRPPDIPSAKFHDFVSESLALLRAASVHMHRNPAESAHTEEAVWAYFMGSCLKQCQTRVETLGRLYRHRDLKAWAPTHGVSFPSSNVNILNTTAEFALRELKVPQNPAGFVFDSETAPLWWECLIRLLNLLRKKILAANERNLKGIANVSAALHCVVKSTPSQMWQYRSLEEHLGGCRGNHTPTSTLVASRSAMVGEKEEGDNDSEAEQNEEAVDVLPSDEPLPASALPQCTVFHRLVDAITAWTTGPSYLLRTPISKSDVPVDVSIINLPRLPVPPVSSGSLLKRWEQKINWTPEAKDDIDEKLRKVAEQNHDGTRGACHCEAGLMASILGLYTQDPEGEELKKLTAVFNNFDTKACLFLCTLTRKHPIGLAKKCCPVCYMLAGLIKSTYEVDLELPGRHNRYHPWVPPHWLPEALLEQLEQEMLIVVSAIVMKKEHLAMSRASSPASDRSAPAVRRPPTKAALAVQEEFHEDMQEA
ncbi:hypothetical protein MVEN_00376800 [Mycena venus]|uniref:Uncharacterized protein n=1 Tax=Mycena venus TaxID=2733690 RepID=A0A8H6YUJ3_9AGAR|nr:hypothetical protein MVEN_00376800 [Mycena venus]